MAAIPDQSNMSRARRYPNDRQLVALWDRISIRPWNARSVTEQREILAFARAVLSEGWVEGVPPPR